MGAKVRVWGGEGVAGMVAGAACMWIELALRLPASGGHAWTGVQTCPLSCV